MVETELSILVGRCLGQRIGGLVTVQHKVHGWQARRNHQHPTYDLIISLEKTRTKLPYLYPSLPAR